MRFISHGGLASDVRKSNIDLNGLQIAVNMLSYSTKNISQETGKLHLSDKYIGRSTVQSTLLCDMNWAFYKSLGIDPRYTAKVDTAKLLQGGI